MYSTNEKILSSSEVGQKLGQSLSKIPEFLKALHMMHIKRLMHDAD